jgi:hypothetical protein
VKADPLWDKIQAKVREIILQPELLAAALQARLDNGEAIDRLEEEIRQVEVKLTDLKRAEQKALRLHLYASEEERDSESEALLLAEQEHIQKQRKVLRDKAAGLRAQVDNLRVAVVDAEGIRRFVANASANLDILDEVRWRVLLEALNLRVIAYDDRIDVEISVPSMEEEENVIMSYKSQCGPRPIKAVGGTTGSTGPPAAWKTAPPLAGPSSASFPTNRWAESSAPSS